MTSAHPNLTRRAGDSGEWWGKQPSPEPRSDHSPRSALGLASNDRSFPSCVTLDAAEALVPTDGIKAPPVVSSDRKQQTSRGTFCDRRGHHQNGLK